MIRITGNTYPVRVQLRALGGEWVERTKAWWVPDDRADEARALVAALPPREPRGPAPGRTAADPEPPGWQPCGLPGCLHYRCHDCEGRGAGGLWRWSR